MNNSATQKQKNQPNSQICIKFYAMNTMNRKKLKIKINFPNVKEGKKAANR